MINPLNINPIRPQRAPSANKPVPDNNAPRWSQKKETLRPADLARENSLSAKEKSTISQLEEKNKRLSNI